MDHSIPNRAHKSPLLTYDDVAERLGVSRRHVCTFVAEGHLPPVRLSKRCVRFDPVDVDKLIQKRKQSSGSTWRSR